MRRKMKTMRMVMVTKRESMMRIQIVVMKMTMMKTTNLMLESNCFGKG
jgi:hypothetical protein